MVKAKMASTAAVASLALRRFPGPATPSGSISYTGSIPTQTGEPPLTAMASSRRSEKRSDIEERRVKHKDIKHKGSARVRPYVLCLYVLLPFTLWLRRHVALAQRLGQLGAVGAGAAERLARHAG